MTQVLQLKMYKYAFDSMYPLTGLIQLSKRRKNPYARSEVMKLLDVVGLNGVGHIKGFFTTCICELSIKEKRESYRTAFAPNTIKGQYVDGTKESQVSPDGYTLDIAYMSRPGNDEKQLDLIFDYQNNVKMYPEFQQYLREYQPPLLAVWGENDVSFIPAGAEAFKKDLPKAEIHLLDTGHFALETHAYENGELMLDFLGKQ
jgi:pimeloyl-ACP methyl ester carboxylesterase